jgi:feruloyl esterase
MNPCAFAPSFTITLRVLVVFVVALSQACLFVVQSASAATYESLATFTLPDTTIVLAKSQPAGTFTPPKPVDAPGTLDKLPAFCRVAVEIMPTKDSDIKFEVWMPESNWNGKFMAIGTGGWAGEIWYPSIGDALRSGYAAACTDTGHEGKSDDASFALGHPEKVIDFGYRAVHEMTVTAKAIVAAYYGHAPRYSYWNGCSTGADKD